MSAHSAAAAAAVSFPTRLGRLELKLEDKKKTRALASAARCKAPSKPDLTDPSLADPQLRSSLIQKLPFDVRHMIYRELILDFGVVLHIFQYRQNLAVGRCHNITLDQQLKEPQQILPLRTGNAWGTAHETCRHRASMNESTFKELRSYMDLAASCKYIYAETLQAMYSAVTFHFIHPFSIHCFVTITPKSQLGLLRSICFTWLIYEPFIENPDFLFIRGQGSRKKQLDEFRAKQKLQAAWYQACEALSSLPSLTNLQIIFESARTVTSAGDVLRPLLCIRNVQNFEVVLASNWLAESVFDDLGEDLPFWITEIREFKGWIFVGEAEEVVTYRSVIRMGMIHGPRLVQRARLRLENLGWL